ncbi:MAG: SprT family zinc-dependent metalloprotease [Deltaproteobacteria bacterium]|nr:SprT family zinc-dependent metalloprotease [Deltaproteobacteria bacterium]
MEQLELDFSKSVPQETRLFTRKSKKRRELLRPRGRHHDLSGIFGRLNRSFFGNTVKVDVTWGKESKNRKRSIQLGVFDRDSNIIRIHPLLDRDFVPEDVVEMVLYHEMLHAYLGADVVRGRRMVHTKRFREAEKAHPYYSAYVEWEKKHLTRLLRGW